MAPRVYFEFVVLRMTYDSHLHPNKPRISFTHRKHSPSASLIEARDWFDLVMARERSKLPQGSKLRYTEWRIISGDAKLFYVEGYLYDKILVFMGEESNYWMFYENVQRPRRIEGSGRLPLTYCACCLKSQYKTVLDTIKNCLSRKG
ncbi:uncharacterized protein LOC105225369 [Bactrocera dorsalis]|uniref:Uncharacterized protein LOC105225369 n=1 Tax=Bactrocera dorsalis TaxID=27457 RepID=A0A6I9V154_BACDO|nr:uncharacterized protein LOC105225369 [Bactrocera dorsalis]XP_049309074.1 uncharacterized protein LOC105225369 [Bactrocera dorsalis]